MLLHLFLVTRELMRAQKVVHRSVVYYAALFFSRPLLFSHMLPKSCRFLLYTISISLCNIASFLHMLVPSLLRLSFLHSFFLKILFISLFERESVSRGRNRGRGGGISRGTDPHTGLNPRNLKS